MRSRRDQVQAHAYVVGRLTSALVHAEPDAPESPLRRTGLGSFGGLLVGALAVAGFMVWGLISPASKASALTAGELLLVKNFVAVTWASGIGPDGRPLGCVLGHITLADRLFSADSRLCNRSIFHGRGRYIPVISLRKIRISGH